MRNNHLDEEWFFGYHINKTVICNLGNRGHITACVYVWGWQNLRSSCRSKYKCTALSSIYIILSYKRVKVSNAHSLLSIRLPCMRLTKRIIHARKCLWRRTSSLWQSQIVRLCSARLLLAAHRNLDKDSWSTLGREICPTKEVREHKFNGSSSIPIPVFINTCIFISDPTQESSWAPSLNSDAFLSAQCTTLTSLDGCWQG